MTEAVLFCPDCGQDNPLTAHVCDDCGRVLSPNPADAAPEQDASRGKTGRSHGRMGATVGRRYRDAYVVAQSVVGIGSALKGLGVLLGVLILMAGALLGTGALVGGESNELRVMVIAALVAVVVGGAWYVAGVILSALGQMLRAQLDLAVTNSPFLEPEEMKRIMSL